MGGIRILILDDSQERLDQFSKRLVGNMVIMCKTARSCINHLKQAGPFEYLFLDHDLGGLAHVDSRREDTGAGVARFLYANPQLKPSKIYVHSFNEPGRKYIKSLLPEAIEAPGVWLQIVPYTFESPTTTSKACQ